MARKEDTPPGILAVLAHGDNVSARVFVAANPSTPAAALRHLYATDECAVVRERLARNKSTPTDVLEKLVRDQDRQVQVALAGNPSTPEAALRRFAKSRLVYMRGNVAANKNLPSSVLTRLAGDDSVQVRFVVADNPSTPIAALARLTQDPDERVSDAAYRALRRRKGRRP